MCFPRTRGEPAYRPGPASGRYILAPGPGAGNDGLHDLSRSVSDLEAQNVAQALLHDPAIVAAVTEAQQTLMHHVIGELGPPPFGHAGLGGMRQAAILQPETLRHNSRAASTSVSN